MSRDTSRGHRGGPIRQPAGGHSLGRQIDAALLGSVDAGLATVLFAVPLILGGRIALGQLVLVALTFWIAVCWCIRQCLFPRATWIRSAAEPLFLAALALVGLQLVAWSPSLLETISPRLYQVLPLWAPRPDHAGALGVWSTISLTPAATRDALILVVAFMLLFLVTVQRIRQVEDVERLIRWIAICTLVVATFGLVQWLTNNGKYFWFYEHPRYAGDQIQGSFTNRNHFAQLIAVGLGSLAWWIYGGIQRRQRHGSAGRHSIHETSSGVDVRVGLKIIALGFTVFVALLSLSRGGAMAVFVAAVICMFVLHRTGLLDRRTMLAVAGAGLFVAGGLCIYGYESVANRLDDFESIEELDNGGRLAIWQASAKGIADFPLTGTGLASFREVCPMYLRAGNYHAIEYTHAENGYVQVALEGGIPGVLLALTAIGTCVCWCLALLRRGTSSRILLCLAAVAPGLAANFAHSMTDFVWYVPGCMVAVVVLAACGCRLWQMAGERAGRASRQSSIPRAGWAAAAACLVLVGYFMLDNRLLALRAEPHWNRYERLSETIPDFAQDCPRETLAAMAEELAAVVRLQPDNARAQLRLAAAHMKLFDLGDDSAISALGVRQVREAAVASQFESSAALHEWLSRAFGEKSEHLDAALHHSRLAMALCPLQGEGYLDLADLSFLIGPRAPAKAEFIAQALRVRPFDGAALFAAGQEAVIEDDWDMALQYWRASFQLGPYYQRQLLGLLTVQVPVEFLLEAFQPDVDAMGVMISYYKRPEQAAQLRLLLERYAAACERRARTLKGVPAAKDWKSVASAYRRLDRVDESARCFSNALECEPSDFDAHYGLGASLFKLGSFAAAEEHLTWCQRSRPHDKNVRSLLEKTVDGRLRAGTAAARRAEVSSLK